MIWRLTLGMKHLLNMQMSEKRRRGGEKGLKLTNRKEQNKIKQKTLNEAINEMNKNEHKKNQDTSLIHDY